MLIAKRLKNYTGYVTTKSRDRGVATSPPRSIICNTVQYEYDYQLGNQYERLRYEYSYDCFFVRFRFTQCNKKYGTRQDPCLQATTPCDRQTDRQTDTRDVKSGGCTDNAERTTQDILRKNHEIEQSPPAHPKAESATPQRRTSTRTSTRSERKFEYGRWRSNILIYHLRYRLRPFDAREDYALASNAESCREQVSSHHFPS